jgi:demethylmenaquinone methyltransferase/2-methoxy-6-polyprenyl-1,4-benzoquinol methylase
VAPAAPLRYGTRAMPEFPPDTAPEDTQFGFTPVSPAEKTRRVRAVFDRVARRYDLMNDLMSAGVHRLWKRALIDWLAPRPGLRLLDVAGGTGDIAFRVLDRTRGTAQAVVCDANFAMLAAGRRRALERTDRDRLAWLCGDAQRLPLPDSCFDAYTIAFGIRNVTDIDRALAEARRVLKPGGRFLCLEFSQVQVPGLDALYDAYSFTVIPALGQMVAGDRDAYQYLVESIRTFPDQEDFARRIAAAGFAQVRHRNLSGGIAALHSAWRL